MEPARAEEGAKVLADERGLAEPFGNNVTGAGKSLLGGLCAWLSAKCGRAFDVGAGALVRISGPQVPHNVGKRLKAQFLGSSGLGAALGTPGKIDVFQFCGVYALFDARLKLGGKGPCLLDGGKDGSLALFHLVVHIYPVLDFRHGGVVHPAGFLFAVAADEGDGVAVGEHVGAILYLPDLCAYRSGYLPKV